MTFLRTYSGEIASITSVLGVLIGLVGFSLTYWQLVKTERTLRASNTYEIQRDARDLVDKINADPKFSAYIKGAEDPDYLTKFENNAWQMFNFYLSVYRQATAGGVTVDFTEAFKKDFCGFVKLTRVGDAWKSMEESGRISDAHKTMEGEWCHAK